MNFKTKPALIFSVLLIICHSIFAQTGWVQKANFPGAARYAVSYFSINNVAYVGCGYDGSTFYKDFYSYNPGTNTWTAIANYPGSGSYGNSSFSIEGKGYVCAGDDAGTFYTDLWCYDPVLNTWTAKANNPNAQGFYSSASFVLGHKAWLICNSYGGPPYNATVWMYDSHTNTWTLKSNFPGGQLEALVAFSIGNRGYAGCGWDGAANHSAMWQYDTTNDTWTPIAAFPGGGGGFDAEETSYVIGTKAYVCFGRTSFLKALPVAWEYDTVTKAWCAFSHLGTIARSSAAEFVLNGRGYMCVGTDSNASAAGPFVNTLYEYDPTSSITVQDSTTCLSKFLGVTTLDVNEAISWSWTFTGGTPATSALQNPSVTYASPGTYAVKLIVSTCGSADTITRNVDVVVGHFPVTIGATPPTVCPGNSTTITAGGGTSYLWNTNATTPSINVSPTSTTTYTVRITNGTCFVDTSINITVSTHFPVTFTSANTSICPGGSSTVTIGGGTAYTWQGGSTNPTQTFTPASTTTYTVAVTNGSCHEDTSVTIVINQKPVTAVASQLLCEGLNVTMTASGAQRYKWIPNVNISCDSCAIVQASPNTTITYTVIGYNGNCPDTAFPKVTVLPFPSVRACCQDTLQMGDTATVSVLGVTPAIKSFLWSPSVDTFGCDSCAAMKVCPKFTTTYTVMVTDTDGCQEPDSVLIVVDGCGTAWIPNAFSPNGDGLNDLFAPKGVCLVTYSMSIYDRWGEIVYTTNNSEPWDGARKNGPPVTGIYIYQISVYDGLRQTKTYVGMVAVLP